MKFKIVSYKKTWYKFLLPKRIVKGPPTTLYKWLIFAWSYKHTNPPSSDFTVIVEMSLPKTMAGRVELVNQLLNGFELDGVYYPPMISKEKALELLKMAKTNKD